MCHRNRWCLYNVSSNSIIHFTYVVYFYLYNVSSKSIIHFTDIVQFWRFHQSRKDIFPLNMPSRYATGVSWWTHPSTSVVQKSNCVDIACLTYYWSTTLQHVQMYTHNSLTNHTCGCCGRIVLRQQIVCLWAHHVYISCIRWKQHADAIPLALPNVWNTMRGEWGATAGARICACHMLLPRIE